MPSSSDGENADPVGRRFTHSHTWLLTGVLVAVVAFIALTIVTAVVNGNWWLLGTASACWLGIYQPWLRLWT